MMRRTLIGLAAFTLICSGFLAGELASGHWYSRLLPTSEVDVYASNPFPETSAFCYVTAHVAVCTPRIRFDLVAQR